MPHTARVALVGDRSSNVVSHTRVPLLLDALAHRADLQLDAYWIPTQDGMEADRFDAVWLLPGSPYRSPQGAMAAVTAAREAGIPFLGTCGGFQHALLEFAHNVCGLTHLAHAENTPDAEAFLIAPLACSLVGHEGTVTVESDSLAESVLSATRTTERYHCNYGPTGTAHLAALRSAGLRLSGHDEAGNPRIAELPTTQHPFFLATLFQPELHGDGTDPHPIIRAFAEAAAAKAQNR